MKTQLLIVLMSLCFIGAGYAQSATDTLYSDTTFSLSGSPYTFTNSNVFIFNNVKVTIEPGVTMLFNAQSGFMIGTDASIEAVGTTTDSIFFLPAPGDSTWYGIQHVQMNALDGSLHYQYVHAVGAARMGMDVESILIENCLIESGGRVIENVNFSFLSSTSCNVRNSTFRNLGDGFLQIPPNYQFSNCVFENIASEALEFLNSPSNGSIGNCEFVNCGTAITGDLENVGITDCSFRQNQIGINGRRAIDLFVRDSEFLENDSAVVRWGDHSFLYGFSFWRCRFENNQLGLSYYGNQRDPAMLRFGVGLPECVFLGNGTNLKFYSSDSLFLQNICWGSLDSQTVANTFAYQTGANPPYQLLPLNTDCIPDLVYPGDSDHDQDCDLDDFMLIGIHHGKSGAARTNPSLNWEGQFANNWGDTLLNGRDIKHVDADGDGSIGTADTAAILLNFGKTHQNPRLGSFQSGTGIPLLLDLPGGLVNPGDTVWVGVHLGTMDSVVQDLYGFHFELGYEETWIEDIAFLAENSWLGTQGVDLLSLSIPPSASALKGGLVRIDQQPQSGFGEIGTLRIIFKDSLPATVPLALTWRATSAIALDESTLPVNATNNSSTFTTALAPALLDGIHLYPNPASDWLVLESTQPIEGDLTMRDLFGRTILKQSLSGTSWKIALAHLPPGIYLLTLKTEVGSWSQKVQCN